MGQKACGKGHGAKGKELGAGSKDLIINKSFSEIGYSFAQGD